MTFLTSFLFVISGFALIVAIAGISRGSGRRRQHESKLAEDMRSAARIARAAAMDAFEIELDGTDASIEVLDHLVDKGWPERERATADENACFVLGAYVGDLLVEHHGGLWRRDAGMNAYPFVYFDQSKLAAKPFDFVKRKLESPASMDLIAAYRRLVQEVTTPPQMNLNVMISSPHSPEENERESTD